MVNQKPNVLIVDDEQVVCDLLYDGLTERGYLCTTALSGTHALTKLAAQDFGVALLDIRLPGISGMEVLRRIRLYHQNTAAIMVTAIDDVDIAVEAMKLGASDYIVKPLDLNKVYTSIHTALETTKCLPEKKDYKASPYLGHEEEGEPAMEELFSTMDAIGRGIEAKLDMLVGHSKTVVERTIDTARQLGISEKGIQRWVAARSMLDSKRDRIINLSPSKVKRSLLAEGIMSVTMFLLNEPNVSESND